MLLIGVWPIATGVAEILAGWQLRREIEGELLLIVGGVLSIMLGVYLVLAPGPGVLAVLWLIGFYAIFAGVLYVAEGLRHRQSDRKASPQKSGSVPAFVRETRGQARQGREIATLLARAQISEAERR